MQVEVKNRLEQCPEKCDYCQASVSTDELWDIYGIFKVVVEISCPFERICKFREESNGSVIEEG